MEEKEERQSEDERIDGEINILDYLIVLAKRKNLIIAITLTVSVITAIYSYTLPKIFRAETRIMMMSEGGKGSSLLNEFSALTGIGNSSPGGIKNPSAIVEIIKSRTVYDRIIERFGLMDIYETDSREDAQKALGGSVEPDIDKSSDIISIAVLNEDPKMAAELANAFVEELKNHLHTFAITEASGRRLFLEKKLKQTKEALIESEEAMREFQEKTGVLKVEDQARAVIESIVKMRAEIAVKEVEIRVMKTYSTVNNPDLQRTQEGLIGLKSELRKLEEKGGNSFNPLMPTGRMPGVGTNYVRKLRDLKFNEGLFEFILKQYEMASIDEPKDPAIIQVIDKANIPERKFQPKRRRMVMISAFVSFCFSLLAAFFVEYIENYRPAGNENRERIETFKKYLSFRKNK